MRSRLSRGDLCVLFQLPLVFLCHFCTKGIINVSERFNYSSKSRLRLPWPSLSDRLIQGRRLCRHGCHLCPSQPAPQRVNSRSQLGSNRSLAGGQGRLGRGKEPLSSPSTPAWTLQVISPTGNYRSSGSAICPHITPPPAQATLHCLTLQPTTSQLHMLGEARMVEHPFQPSPWHRAFVPASPLPSCPDSLPGWSLLLATPQNLGMDSPPCVSTNLN